MQTESFSGEWTHLVTPWCKTLSKFSSFERNCTLLQHTSNGSCQFLADNKYRMLDRSGVWWVTQNLGRVTSRSIKANDDDELQWLISRLLFIAANEISRNRGVKQRLHIRKVMNKMTWRDQHESDGYKGCVLAEDLSEVAMPTLNQFVCMVWFQKLCWKKQIKIRWMCAYMLDMYR